MPDFGVLIDAEVFGMSPFGGLIRYWSHLLEGLEASGLPVRVLWPDNPRAALPPGSGASRTDACRWLYHSTYTSPPLESVHAEVYTVHDTIFEDFPVSASRLDPEGEQLRSKRLRISAADYLIVPSRATLRGLVQHYAVAPERVSVIPEGVDRCYSAPLPPDAVRARDRLLAAVGVRRPYLLHVGGREHYKNFEFLLSTWVSTNLHRRFDLLVVGSQHLALPGEQDILQHQPADGLAFTGPVSESMLCALYRTAAVLVSPSLAEGFGLPPLEAAAGGTPVALSSIAIFEETLGGAGQLFDPTSIEDAERAILVAAETSGDDRRRTSARIARQFDWGRTVRKTLSIYSDARSRHRASDGVAGLLPSRLRGRAAPRGGDAP